MHAHSLSLSVLFALPLLLALALPCAHAGPAPAASECLPDGQQASGAVYRICMPEDGAWNGDLIIYAHGYVRFDQPVGIPEDQLCVDGLCVYDLVNALGYGFATTSYSVNGLAVEQGLADVLDLVEVFRARFPAVNRVLLLGASEGALISTLAQERHPGTFAGTLAGCGPIGDFRFQLDYLGDFLVVFDYFFPGLLPGGIDGFPDWLLEDWGTYFRTEIEPVIRAPENLGRLLQIIRVTGLPLDYAALPENLYDSIEDALEFNVFGTNDSMEKLGGQPFDNLERVYAGSRDDEALNAGVQRVAADPAALETLAAHYETSGLLTRPLVTLHTTRDELIPYAHNPLYQAKVDAQGSADFLTHLKIRGYGHCQFSVGQVLAALVVLLVQVQGEVPDEALVRDLLGSDEQLRAYRETLARTLGR